MHYRLDGTVLPSVHNIMMIMMNEEANVVPPVSHVLYLNGTGVADHTVLMNLVSNQIFNAKLHRYSHYYRCVGMCSVTFFCASTVWREKKIPFCVLMSFLFLFAVISKEVLRIIFTTQV